MQAKTKVTRQQVKTKAKTKSKNPAAARPAAKSKPKTTAVADQALPELTTRSSGVLLHVSSLSGPAPVGDLGASARAFVDFLVSAGQRWWQMLPVNPIGAGNSPYSTISSLAGESLFISGEDLLKDGFISPAELASARAIKIGNSGKSKTAKSTGAKKSPAQQRQTVDYDLAQEQSHALLHLAFANSRHKHQAALQKFSEREHDWLQDYALFVALAERYDNFDWSTWPESLKRREPQALAAARNELAEAIQFHTFVQYIFDLQWQRLRDYAHVRGVALIGDLPIFVGYKSVDVWANSDYFLLSDKTLRPEYVAGCPPDAFSPDGQLWGNALYDWEALKQDGYQWWLARLRRTLAQFDAIRLDHFIGFARYWRIPANAKTAAAGKWMPAPGEDFFQTVKGALGRTPFIAEDLGAVTPQIRALRDQFGFPGMKVLQFGFDGSEEAKVHAAHLLPDTSAVYTGTHDNDTARGWFMNLEARAKKDTGARAELNRVITYFATDAKRVHYDLLTAAMGSAAKVVITPIQDILGLDGSQRMNVPGTAQGNWTYRLQAQQLTASVAATLQELTRVYDR